MLGLDGQSLVFVVYHIGGDFSYNFMPLITWLRGAYPQFEPLFYKLLFAYALLRFDVFHYFCDRGILPPVKPRGINPLELELLRMSGKRLYAYPYGGDVRVRSTTLQLGAVNLCANCDKIGWHCVCDFDEARENIENISRVATSLVSMGDMIHYMPGAHIMQFWPIEIEKFSPNPPQKFQIDRPLQIVHAPNHPQFKGTAAFERALDQLKGEGFQFVYTRIQGMSNSEVISTIKNADLVFDQLTAGFHGYTAVEGIALAKPVICFVRDRQMVSAWEECPFISATPDTIYEILKKCMCGELDLQAIGSKGRRYAERYYSKQAVARNLADLYIQTAQFPGRISRQIAEKREALEASIRVSPKLHSEGPYFADEQIDRKQIQ
ncbi:MAG: hypothetical protein P1U84_16635 [Parvibaculaceae bacterium]|nr:hypothetical protein [Parvibaculaceae bacterium]